MHAPRRLQALGLDEPLPISHSVIGRRVVVNPATTQTQAVAREPWAETALRNISKGAVPTRVGLLRVQNIF